jgi:hypothetical protein
LTRGKSSKDEGRWLWIPPAFIVAGVAAFAINQARPEEKHPNRRCPACGEVWFAEEVALRFDELLTGMLATELVAIRSYSEAAPTAA